MLHLICLERLDCHVVGSSSESVVGLPARETVVLPPTDHSPPVSLESYWGGRDPAVVSQYVRRLLLGSGAVVAGSISIEDLGGRCMMSVAEGEEKVMILPLVNS